jgi:hypothetical protein
MSSPGIKPGLSSSLASGIKLNKAVFKALFVLLCVSLFFFVPKDYLGDAFPLCVYRRFTGNNCIGCGTTRAVWSVLHLKFADALEYNRLIPITFPLLAGCTLCWIFFGKAPKRKKPPRPGARINQPKNPLARGKQAAGYGCSHKVVALRGLILF